MSITMRLNDLADVVKEAGLRGESMTDTLTKVADLHDLSGEEIDRVAEIANRAVQRGLYKEAVDKRFKFDLARPRDVKTASRSAASTSHIKSAGLTEKIAAAIDDEGGDPFAAPLRAEHANTLSLVTAIDDARLDEIATLKRADADRELLLDLGKAESELLALQTEGLAHEVKCAADAANYHKQMIQSAADLIYSGVTLPSLYEAIYAGVSGTTCTDADRDNADDIARMVISELKKRGVENYRMGFRDHGDPDAIEAMTEDQLLQKCKALCSYTRDPRASGTISHLDVKSAEVHHEEHVKHTEPKFMNGQHHLQTDADGFMRERESAGKVPQQYLDDADNYEDGKPRVVNANSEFVIAVKNLVGEQTRLRQVHGAQEYIGLKLKQIEEACNNLREVQATEKSKANTEGVG